jgi:soluble lytic murein transglycosylase-like protein
MHPETSLSVGRLTSAQAATAYFSDQFLCLSLITLLAAFFFLFAMPKFEATLHHTASGSPIGHLANSPAVDGVHPLIRLAQADAEADAQADVTEEPAGEANLSDSDLVNRWQPYIAEASQRFGIPQNWIRAVIRIESGGRTVLLGQPITSEAGAMGVMQLMRRTYEEMSERHDLGPNPYNVRDNILAGTAYLRDLYKKYGFPRLFAAYNAGPGRLEDHLFHGASLPAETRAYLIGVVKQISKTCVLERRAPGRARRVIVSDCRTPQRA